MAELLMVRTPVLEIAYEASGPEGGTPVVLLHGFPDDARAYDGATRPLASDGCRVLVPYLRGYGATRFLSSETPRSGEQAALGADLRDFMDALDIERAVVGGYDWGGRAACVVAALWPERVIGLVTCGGYNVQNIARALNPGPAEAEYRAWYQWYFNTERGRNGLQAKRGEIARLLWQLWSPNWRFDDVTFDRTAASFDNTDFVDVVIHSYRNRHQNAAGDPAYAQIESRLAGQPAITVPTIALYGEADGVTPGGARALPETDPHFTGRYARRVVPVAGHFLPHEAPEAVAQAVRDLLV